MSNHKTTVSTNDGQPHFYITKSKNRLKLYNKTNVYLDDNQEFEIELFNPTQKKVMAKVYLNGNLISASGLVLRPGERYYLDRFIDDPKKFKYETYKTYVINVGNKSKEEAEKELKKAIENNGLVEVEFYDEYVPLPTFTIGSNWINTTTPYQPIISPYTNPWKVITADHSILNNNTFYYQSGTPILTGTITTTTNNNSVTYSVNNVSTSTYQVPQTETKKEVETGRVEKGSESNQTFGNDYSSYNLHYTTKQSFKILPTSQKLIESKDIRSYCTNCGVRQRNQNSWKFCPSCGTKF